MFASCRKVVSSLLLASGLSVSAMTASADDIVDTAAAAGEFNTLIAAIQAAGLEDTLRNEGPFTVFAPNDAAFAKLPDGTLENLLLPENREQLAALLTYHVSPGRIGSADISGAMMSVTTVQGGLLLARTRDGLSINDSTVIAADIVTDNGIIHVIDTVLLP
ncbi:MAG: Nex18 symbiotically induced protein [Gammaproteobacteria bacterium]|nr:Nex18 symbiotically induced protein [Gammaproteobacteria bacterium]|tara:strand:- start:60 stop:545 length:486 start_codon:yes stop_codon:yes gene_type:complete